MMALSFHRMLYFAAGLLLGIMAPKIVYEACVTFGILCALPWPWWVRAAAADPILTAIVVCAVVLLIMLVRFCRSNGRPKWGRRHDD